MALYFLRTEPPAESPKNGAAPRGQSVWISYVGALLIVSAAIIQGIGLDSLSLPLASKLLPAGFVPPAPRVLLLAMDRDAEGFDPLDVAMALRGLGKLHPSKIVINGNVRRKSDSLTILEGMRERLRQEGIDLIEGTPASPESLWRPVPICTYAPPLSLHLGSPLPRVPGNSAAEGKACFLPSGDEKISPSLPLLAATDAGEIAGSIWWEAMKPRQMTGSTWLLGGKVLLFPNHSTLLLSSGAISPLSTSSAMMVSMDLFLLRIEEMERGTISPDFEVLWEHATVVLGSADDIDLTGSFHAALQNTFFHRLPLPLQALLALLLILVLFTARRLTRGKQLGVGLAVLVVTIAAGVFALNHALLLPLLAPLISTSSLLLPSLLPSRR